MKKLIAAIIILCAITSCEKEQIVPYLKKNSNVENETPTRKCVSIPVIGDDELDEEFDLEGDGIIEPNTAGSAGGTISSGTRPGKINKFY